ncbi:MAG TPA: hypothetical protein VFQ41_23300 [Candidatus Angelobacter sp.]|nr:hypothetical protein [Candidatus Angelobacter sp.]
MKSIGRSRAEMADTIERFVDGICRRWDWDDFCCVPIIDPHLDSIRVRCAGLPQEYPPVEKGHYCSEAGIQILRQIVFELRRPRTPS